MNIITKKELSIFLRVETVSDYKEIYELVKCAFATQDYHDTADNLNDARKKDILAIGRDAESLDTFGTIDEGDVCDGLSPGVDGGHLARHIVYVGRTVRQEVGHKEGFAIGRQIGCDRLAHDPYAGRCLSVRQIDKGDIVVELIADHQCLAIRG